MYILTSLGDRYQLQNGQNRIGRGNDCDLQLDNSDVSRHHAMVRLEDGLVQIMDLGSTNGTVLNDKQLPPYEYAPLSIFISVDLPAPFSPSSTCTSPACTSKST